MTGHKYDVSKAERLDDPQRQLLIPSTKILQDINPKSYEVWADIGCGTGFFSIPLSGFAKKVYALDISIEMLENLKQKLLSSTANNIELVQSEESSLPLENESMDCVFLAFVAHEVNNPIEFFSEITRILKPGGRLTIVEFAKVESSYGPPLSHRLAPEQMDTWAFEVGLKKGQLWEWSRSIVGWEYLKTNAKEV